MNLKISIILLILTIVGSSVFAQEIIYNFGLSQSNMRDLKSLQNYEINLVPVKVKITQAFPPFFQYGVSMRWTKFNMNKFGFHLYTTSTGARSTYEDYSGKITYDYLARCGAFALVYQRVIYTRNKIEISLFGELSTIFSKVKVIHFAKVIDEITTDNRTYNSVNLGNELGGQIKYSISKHLFFEGRLGSLSNLNGALYDSNDDYLVLANSKKATCDWSGFKLSIGLGYRFK